MGLKRTSLDLDWYELITCQRAVNRYLRETRKAITANHKRGWEPEPGKRDVNKLSLQSALVLNDKISEEIKRIKRIGKYEEKY